MLGNTGTINLTDGFITGLAGTFFKGLLGWVFGALFVAYIAGTGYLARRRGCSAGLPRRTDVAHRRDARPSSPPGPRSRCSVFDQNRGLPLSLVFLVGLVVVMDFVVRRTRFGRMIFAVGGNAEAARRAGMPVQTGADGGLHPRLARSRPGAASSPHRGSSPSTSPPARATCC